MNSLTRKEALEVMMPRPCQHCGACCRGFAIEIYNEDIQREPRLLEHVTAWDEIEKDKQCRLNKADFALLLENEKCPFLNDKSQCSIHPTRPIVCQTYPPSLLVCHVSRLEERGLDCTSILREVNIPFNIYAAIILSIDPETIPPIGKNRGVSPQEILLIDLVDETFLKKQLQLASLNNLKP
jgi:Fe-S-cluster containining protein